MSGEPKVLALPVPHKVYVRGPVPSAAPMPRILFLSSLQDYQGPRVLEIAGRLKRERPELHIEVKGPEASRAELEKFKLRFGPAVVIDGRLEFVGVPRYRMLVERIAKSAARPGAPSPGPVAKPAEAPKAPGPRP